MKDESTPPLISIGMPVRNEERFIADALDSLLAQKDARFEILISDNASTDQTPAICQRYSREHEHIHYHRFEHNVGAWGNFRRVLEAARGDFFMWASGHDRWADNFLHDCARALSETPGAVLAFGTSQWIDASGAPYPRAYGWTDTRGMSVVGRYFTIFWGNMNPILGLMRREALSSQKIDDIIGMDLVILERLALRGDFIHVPSTHWQRREFREEMSYEQKLERYRSSSFAVDTTWLGRHFPLAALPARLIRDLAASGLKWHVKTLALLTLFTSLPLKYLVDRSRTADKSA